MSNVHGKITGLLDRAIRTATELQDENLCATLQLVEGDLRLETLLQLPPESVRSEAGSHSDVGNVREVMCPDLYRAVKFGCINRVNDLLGPLEDITNINIASHDLHVASEGTHESVTTTEQWGGRVHGEGSCTLQEVTAEKNTLLHITAEQGYPLLTKQIIDRDNTLLVSENSRKETPLHLAARAGHSSIVSLILLQAQKSGIGAYAVLSKRNIEGDIALHDAARHGHEKVVQALMTIAPRLSAVVNEASMSPLYLAVVKQSIGVVKALLEYKHPSAVGPNKQNALHAAVLQSQQITSMLLDWKAELANERDTSGSTPMHYAASSGDFSTVEMILIKAPLSAYIQDTEGSSPLHVAAKMQHYSVLTLMLDHCPDSIELCDNLGQNFLHILTQHGGRLTKLSRFDLKKISNMRDNEGNTPLHFACRSGFAETILDLLKIGADPAQMNNNGMTALDYAVSVSSFLCMVGTVVSMSINGASFSPQRQDILKSRKDETKEYVNKTSKNLIIVSVLIATIAFSAAFNVPGSYNSDGVANFRQKINYNIFLLLDTIAMSASVAATMLLVISKAERNEGTLVNIFFYSLTFLWISLVAMEFAFVMAVTLTLGTGKPATIFFISFISSFFLSWTVFFFSIYASPLKLNTMRKFLSFTNEETKTARQVALQFPTLALYVRRVFTLILINIFLSCIMFFISWAL